MGSVLWMDPHLPIVGLHYSAGTQIALPVVCQRGSHWMTAEWAAQ